jgi:glycosyltransferase involved in cell wall biosynthesis
MLKITVVVPTHNRPRLLREALASIVEQTYEHWEVVIVDDGSQTAVDQSSLQTEFGPNIRVIRNEIPGGLKRARLQGARAAKGQLLAQLDDDDLLAPEALQKSISVLQSDSSIDMVFIGTKGFGKASEYNNRVAKEANEKVITIGQGVEIGPGIYKFGKELFSALLYSVPHAFQHPVVRRNAWNSVDHLLNKAKATSKHVDDKNSIPTKRIRFGDSEWAIYAAAICRAAFIDHPLYLNRCEGQSFFSTPSQRPYAVEALINIRKVLFVASNTVEQLYPWQAEIKDSLSQAYFGKSYYYFYNQDRLKAWEAICESIRIKPNYRNIRFLCRTFFPRKF